MPQIPMIDFSAGELSPKMRGRIDAPIYMKGLEESKNFCPIEFGGMTRRPGTWRVVDVTAENMDEPLVIPFVNDSFDNTMLFVWEDSNTIYAQPIRYDGSALTAGTKRSLSNTFPGHVSRTTKWVRIDNDIYFANTDLRPFTLSSDGTADGWSLAWTDFSLPEWDSGRYYTKGDIVTYSAADYIAKDASTEDEPNLDQTPAVGTYWAAYTGPTVPDFMTNAALEANDTARGPWYPGCVTAYVGRLVYGGSLKEPMSLWGSGIRQYNMFVIGSNDDSPWKHVLSADDSGRIHWLVAAEYLIAGAGGGEFVIAGNQFGITPTSIQIQTRTYHGSCDAQPILLNDQVIFAQSDQQQLRGYSYLDTIARHYGAHVNAASDHIYADNIVSMVMTRSPRHSILSVLESGKIVRFGYSRELQEISFSPWEQADEGDGWLNLGVLPASNTDEDMVFAVSKYGSDTYIELFHWIDYYSHEDPAITTLTLEYGMYLDSAEEVTISEDDDGFYIDGLSDWEGETIDIVIDGASHQEATVSGGEVRINHGGDEAYIGYAFTSRAKTMNFGPVMVTKRTHEVGLRFIYSVGGQVGVTEDNLETMVFREGDVNYDEAIPLYSGDKYITVAGPYDRDAFVYIQQEEPLPMTLLAIVARTERYE